MKLKKSEIPAKKMISEQNNMNPTEKKLNDMIESGFIKQPASVVRLKGTSDPNLMFAIKKESVKSKNVFNYAFINGQIGTFSNGKFIFLKERWDVSAYDRFLQKKQSDEQKTRQEIDKVKKEQNWKERSEITASDTDLLNKDKWEKIEIGGIPLYREKSTITVPSTYEGDAKKILDYFRKIGWQSADEVPAYLRLPSNAKKISELFPEWRQYFTDDITLYFNSEYKKQQETTPEDENAPKERLSQFLTSLEQLTTDDCVKYIDNLYQGYRFNPSDVPTPEIKEKVKIVQYCIRKFNFDTPIYSKTRKKIFVLAGYSSSKDVGTPQASPYRISLPNNYKP